jgi:hypothetical protein
MHRYFHPPYPSLSALLIVHELLDTHPSSVRCPDRLESPLLHLPGDLPRRGQGSYRLP